jgi:hypothetical protein
VGVGGGGRPPPPTPHIPLPTSRGQFLQCAHRMILLQVGGEVKTYSVVRDPLGAYPEEKALFDHAR